MQQHNMHCNSCISEVTASILKQPIYSQLQGCLFLVLPQVKEVHVKENGSIGEDEVILEFYQEEP